ncbi:MAG: hypothetical protein AB8B94_02795 [Hyphomicrobiales bacterium]
MAQNDAGLISGKIRELTRLIRETRLADTAAFKQLQELETPPDSNAIAETLAQKVRAHTRLEALSQALKGVYSEIPKSAQPPDNAFTFALLPGTPPRFWVDLTSFVVMMNDGTTYQFLKDARDGRVSLHESDDLESTASAITDYVAERILEQHAEIIHPPQTAAQIDVAEVDTAEVVVAAKPMIIPSPEPIASEPALPRPPETPPTPIIIQPAPAKTDWVKLFLAFSLGVFVGGVVLFLLAWFQTPAAS